MSLGLDWATLPDDQAEESIFHYVRSYDETARLGYAQIGLMCRDVYNRMLWRHRTDADGQPCRSFARWLRLCAPFAYSTAYAAMRDVEELADVPDAQIAQIAASNFATMKQLSTAVRNSPDVLEVAQTKASAGLVEHIKEHFPEQHLESRKDIRFAPTESQLAEIERAIAQAMQGGASSRTEALWQIAVSFNADTLLEAILREKGTYAEPKT